MIHTHAKVLAQSYKDTSISHVNKLQPDSYLESLLILNVGQAF